MGGTVPVDAIASHVLVFKDWYQSKYLSVVDGLYLSDDRIPSFATGKITWER